MTIPLEGSDSEEEMLYTNFLFNTVARIHNLTIRFEYQRVRNGPGGKVWEANLFVNETLEATGYGVRKGHAKNEASRIYAINRGFRVPSPLS